MGGCGTFLGCGKWDMEVGGGYVGRRCVESGVGRGWEVEL